MVGKIRFYIAKLIVKFSLATTGEDLGSALLSNALYLAERADLDVVVLLELEQFVFFGLDLLLEGHDELLERVLVFLKGSPRVLRRQLNENLAHESVRFPVIWEGCDGRQNLLVLLEVALELQELGLEFLELCTKPVEALADRRH